MNHTPNAGNHLQRIRNAGSILTGTTFLNNERATSVILSVGLIIFQKIFSPGCIKVIVLKQCMFFQITENRTSPIDTALEEAEEEVASQVAVPVTFNQSSPPSPSVIHERAYVTLSPVDPQSIEPQPSTSTGVTHTDLPRPPPQWMSARRPTSSQADPRRLAQPSTSSGITRVSRGSMMMAGCNGV